jgi:GTPase SAR1 family protein
MTGFGQLVIGPPGSGKTTYCNGIQHFFALAGRPCAVVNLDPANHNPPYECAVSIEELISLEEVQNELDLGPNGGMVYCMEYVAKNLDWLRDRVAPLVKEGKYVLFDLPGQVELFTSHDAVKQIIRELTASKATDMDLRLCTVHLVDGHLCADPSKYIAALMLSLQSMLHLETPHVNVLSKVDLMDKYGDLDFNLEYYADVQDLHYLADRILGENDEPEGGASSTRVNAKAPLAGTRLLRKKYGKLTRELCELVEDFGLVNFATLSIEDKESVTRLVRLTDKCVGYVNAGGFSRATANEAAAGEYAEPGTFDERELISHAPSLTNYERHMEVQERFFRDPDASRGGDR